MVDGFFTQLPAEGLSNEDLLFSYRDPTVEPGRTYVYKIDYLLSAGLFNCFVTDRIDAFDPVVILDQNKPNPFNPSTTLSWCQPGDGDVNIEIFDVAGRRIIVLENGFKSAGAHSIKWNGKDGSGNNMSSGIYFCRLSYGGTIRTRKMVLLR
jgi:hypothetical protein